jgi:hypothetical protein
LAGNAEGAACAAQGPKGARRNKAEKEDAAYDFKDRINFSVFPSLQGGPHNHQARPARSAAACAPAESSGNPERCCGGVGPDAEAAQHTGNGKEWSCARHPGTPSARAGQSWLLSPCTGASPARP